MKFIANLIGVILILSLVASQSVKFGERKSNDRLFSRSLGPGEATLDGGYEVKYPPKSDKSLGTLSAIHVHYCESENSCSVKVVSGGPDYESATIKITELNQKNPYYMVEFFGVDK